MRRLPQGQRRTEHKGGAARLHFSAISTIFTIFTIFAISAIFAIFAIFTIFAIFATTLSVMYNYATAEGAGASTIAQLSSPAPPAPGARERLTPAACRARAA